MAHDEDDLIKVRRPKKKEQKPKREKIRHGTKTKKEEHIKKSAEPIAVDLFENGDKPEKKINKEYLKISKRYKSAKYISIVLLAAFLLGVFLFYRESITYENLMYLVRDFDSGTDSGVGVYSEINYGELFVSDMEMFKGKIAVAGTAGVTLYNAAGSSDMYSGYSYSSPVISAGEKYMLIYDRGGKGFSVYNSVSRILKETSETEISDGVMGDDGTFAILTRGKDTKYLIDVYGPDLVPMMKYHKDKYVVDMAISPDGDEITVVSMTTEGAGIKTEIETGYLGTKKTVKYELSVGMPLSVVYTGDDSAAVLFDSMVLGVSEGNEKYRIDLGGKVPSSFDTENGIGVLSCRTNVTGSESELIVFDKDGKVLYNEAIGAKIVFVSAGVDGHVYAAGDGRAFDINVKDGSLLEEKLPERTVKLLSPTGHLIACTETGSVNLFIDRKID